MRGRSRPEQASGVHAKASADEFQPFEGMIRSQTKVGRALPRQGRGDIVFINGRFLSQMLTGVQRFALEIVKAIDRTAGGVNGVRFVVLSPRNAGQVQGLRHIELRKVGRLTGHAWDQIELPMYARGGPLLSLCNSGPVAHPCHIVAIHDAAVFANGANFSLSYCLLHKTLAAILSRTAKTIVTVSEFSRRELARYMPAAAEKLRVVSDGADHILDEPADMRVLKAHGLIPHRFVFALGSLSPNKNTKLIIEAFRLLNNLDLRLVLVGGQASHVFANSSIVAHPWVISLGNRTDGEIRALYENAFCFVFPSFYEGFGIPPVEAMLCGCPVIISDIPALRETCGDAALYCDPRDAAGLAKHIAALAAEPSLRERLRNLGLSRAQSFTWGRSANIVLELIEEALVHG